MESGKSVISVSEWQSVVSSHANAWSKKMGKSISVSIALLSLLTSVSIKDVALFTALSSTTAGIVSSATRDSPQKDDNMITSFFKAV